MTSCSISCKDDHSIRTKSEDEANQSLSLVSKLAFCVSYPIRDLADTTNGSIRLPIRWFLSLLLRLPLQSFVSPFIRNLVSLFLLVSEDRQTELATKVHVGVVVCWNRDHVPRLKNLPANRIAHCKK